MLLNGSLARHTARRCYSSISADTILAKAMDFVPHHGWQGALVESCRALNMSDQATSLFSPEDLVKYHYKQELLKLKDYEPRSTGLVARLEELLLYRLIEGNGKLGAGRLGEAMHIGLGTRMYATPRECLSEVSDEIWYKAGDRSSDTTWYTRRGSLAGIYAFSEAFQARDSSRDFKDTKSVARSLVQKMATVEDMGSSVSEWVDFNLRATFNVLRTWR